MVVTWSLDAENLFVTVDDFVAEPVRWILEVDNGFAVVFTKLGAPIMRLAPTTSAALNRVSLSDHVADQAPGGAS